VAHDLDRRKFLPQFVGHLRKKLSRALDRVVARLGLEVIGDA
jgi:hypothetical protein